MSAAFKYGLLSMVVLSLGISIGCSRASSTVAAAPPPQSTAATQYTYETVMAFRVPPTPAPNLTSAWWANSAAAHPHRNLLGTFSIL